MADMIRHVPTGRIGRLVCATSDASWGAPRVIVEWDGGEEQSVAEAELEPIVWVHFHRIGRGSWV